MLGRLGEAGLVAAMVKRLLAPGLGVSRARSHVSSASPHGAHVVNENVNVNCQFPQGRNPRQP